jgi:hypothetical protein
MRRFILLAALGLSGCGPDPLSMAATPDSARPALVAALDGWKAGRTFRDLADGSPPVQFIDDDLNRGARLLDYVVEGEPRPNGTGYRFVVTLTLREGAAKRPPKKVAYTVVTRPHTAVTREDRQP